MLGQLLNFILLLGLGILAQACGRPSHVAGAPHFISAQITVLGDGSELSVNRRLTRTWQDYDGDGLSDRLDPDIDDDGVPNLADQYPFNGKLSGEDADHDGMADFIDLSFAKSAEAKRLAQLQEDIFKQLDVVVMNGSETFTKAEWQQLHDTLFNKVLMLKLQYRELKVVVRYSKADQPGESRADFDPLWQQISFYPNPDHQNNVLAFNGSLVHELGHVHAAENPADYQQFAAHFETWASPSRYGESSPEEGYAENFVYQLLLAGAVKVDAHRFDLI